jgi:hypothetical protein
VNRLLSNRSHPLPSGGAARVKLPPSGDRWLRPGKVNRLLSNRSHPLPSGGAARVKPPPSGDRWLRPGKVNRLLSNRSHPLPSGGSGASKASTVWRQVATSGDRESSAAES